MQINSGLFFLPICLAQSLTTFRIFLTSIIVPREMHTDTGDSEHPGGMKTYCTEAGAYDPSQGLLAPNFWRSVEFQTGYGPNGGRFAQRMLLPLKFSLCSKD